MARRVSDGDKSIDGVVILSENLPLLSVHAFTIGKSALKCRYDSRIVSLHFLLWCRF